MPFHQDLFSGIGGAIERFVIDPFAQFVGGVGRQFGVGPGGPGRGAGVLAPEFQPRVTRAGQLGEALGQQAINVAERLVVSTLGIPGGSTDPGDIYANFPAPPTAGRPSLDPTRAGQLPTGAGGTKRPGVQEIVGERGIIGEVPGIGGIDIQTAGVGDLLGLIPEALRTPGAITAGAPPFVAAAAEFLGGLFGGGNGMARDVTIALPGGASTQVTLPLGGALFRPTMGGLRPANLVIIPNPLTGKPTFFGNLGPPLLFRRDLLARKKVNKLARLAARGR